MGDPELDKVKGMFAGLFMGDARGAQFEFPKAKKYKYSDRIENPIPHRNRWTGEFKQGTIGQVTDDSEKCIALTRSIVKNSGYQLDSAIQDYLDWAYNSKSFLGKNTRALLTVKTIRGYQNRYKKVYSCPREEWSQSNGSLMHCAPLFPFSKQDIIDDCKITNPHPINIECNLLYLRAMKLLYRGKDAERVYNIIRDKAKLPEIQERFESDEFDYKENKGHVLHAFQIAMNTLLDDRDYNHQIRDIIKLGGDTDTNAAISGALIGMRYGYDTIMDDPINVENWEIVKNCDPELGDFPKPKIYTLKGIDRLILKYYRLIQ